MARISRQSKILELISQKPIETQEELVEELLNHKLKVTQATISRDIKELGLIKIMDEVSKRYKYAYIDNENQKVTNKTINIFKHTVTSIDSANNLIIIKTLSGSANAAAAVVDKLSLSTILGSIAGDDTVLLIIRTNEDVQEVLEILNGYME